MTPFQFARTPQVIFGAGTARHVGRVLGERGVRAVCVVTGSSSLRESPRWPAIEAALRDGGRRCRFVAVAGEPDPDLVDAAAEDARVDGCDVVVGIGGGSVIDAAKAIAAMAREEGSIVDLLEGVGRRAPRGERVGLIAMPTTAGTGSEATKNAVISRVGPGGFKKSLRHDAFVPDAAIIDPELALQCPRSVTAASGLDAVTQLLESYVSTGASALTDALAEDGLRCAARGLFRAVDAGATDVDARGLMAYAAFLSGVTLANAGLGVVHGIASPLGGLFPVPHGVVCGTLLAECTVSVVAAAEAAGGPASALEKYARAGDILSGDATGGVADRCARLVQTLREWVDRLEMPRLGTFGIGERDLRTVAETAAQKSAPVALPVDEIHGILLRRM